MTVRISSLLFCVLLLSRRDAEAAPPPPTMLWAWEIPQDLRFLRNPGVGVAFLATTLLLRNDQVLVRRRMQPLRASPDTPVMAVVRIESDPRRRPRLLVSQRTRAADLIQDVVLTTRVSAVQIDYDTPASERGFYRLLLRDVRSRLGAATFLSITALVSWCQPGTWLKGLPVDEVVPMLFRMGAEGPSTLYRLNRGGDFPAPECRQAYGLSLDEPRPPRRADRREYFFSAAPWKPLALQRILEENRKESR